MKSVICLINRRILRSKGIKTTSNQRTMLKISTTSSYKSTYESIRSSKLSSNFE